MTLRTQLLIISLLTLSLPWAGCQYVQQMETTLRKGQQDSLLATAHAIALLAENNQIGSESPNGVNADFSNDIYADTISWPIFLDGYKDDWNTLEKKRTPLGGNTKDKSVEYIAARHKDDIYLFITVNKKAFNFGKPGSNFGDHFRLSTLNTNNKLENYILSSSGTGFMQAQHERPLGRKKTYRYEQRIQAYLQQTTQAWQIEIKIPIQLLNHHLGISFIDSSASKTAALSSFTGSQPGALILKDNNAERILKPFESSTYRLRITDHKGWVISELGELKFPAATIEELQEKSFISIWMKDFYRIILNSQETPKVQTLDREKLLNTGFYKTALSGTESTNWLHYANTVSPDQNNSKHSIIVAVYPIRYGNKVGGLIVIEQPTDAILSLTDDALQKLFNISFIAIFLTVSALIGFASLLSWRIYRLKDSAEQSIASDGKVSKQFSASKTADELGDLSRSFASLIENIAEYNNYLETLASKLSHELRTPLAMVKSSLENISLDSHEDKYLERAGQGVQRLQNIISSMSEASRLEQALQHTDKVNVDLGVLLDNITQSYQKLYSSHTITLKCVPDENTLSVCASPELLMQLLDKLLSNAADFTPEGETIIISCEDKDSYYEVAVSNTGPLLPENMQHHLFDSMISIRTKKTDSPNLGLGLYIAKLIAEFHGGNISARNRQDRTGVVISFTLPK